MSLFDEILNKGGKKRTIIVKMEIIEVDEEEVSKKGRNILYEQALKYVGMKEISGIQNHPKIIEWLGVLGFDKKFGIKDDETPWCSTGTSGCCFEVGLPYAPSPRAKAFSKVGRIVTIDEVLEIQANGHDVDYGFVVLYHRRYIPKNVYDGSGHVEILGSVLKDKKTLKSIGFNVSDSAKKTTRTTLDKNFIEIRLLEKL